MKRRVPAIGVGYPVRTRSEYLAIFASYSHFMLTLIRLLSIGQLGTPTWRASRKWTNDVVRANAAAVELVREVAQPASGVRGSLLRG
jgi:hypothetical protein